MNDNSIFNCESCGRTLPKWMEENESCSQCAANNNDDEWSNETDDDHSDGQAEVETRPIESIKLTITDVSNRWFVYSCVAQLPEQDGKEIEALTEDSEIKFRLLHDHVNINPSATQRYNIKNAKLVFRSNKRYLRSTEDTRIEELSPKNPVDEMVSPVTEMICDNPRQKRYHVLEPDGEQLELRLHTKHNLNRTQLSGLHKITNLRRTETADETYLESTQATTIQCPPNSAVDLDIFIIGDTHIGYRSLSPDVRDYQKEAFRQCFNLLITEALQQSIDAIVHTGDIFESNEPADDDINWLSQQIKKLQNGDITFAFIRGNHDPINQPKQLSTLENFVHMGNGDECGNSGFSFTGYDCDQVKHLSEIKSDRLDQELAFIHPKELDCRNFLISGIPDTEVSDSIIFSGHCHTPGKTVVGDTPLIFTGSLGGLGTGEKSFFRAKIWEQKVAIVYYGSIESTDGVSFDR